MDKLAYHFNKKKIPAETKGTYLYYYPCDDLENAMVRMGKDGYIVIEVTEKEWEALFELDRIDYNNEHKYVRHTSPISDDEEDELPVKEQEAFISDEPPISTATAEKMDKENLFSKLSEDDRQILNLLNGEHTQKQIAEKFGVTQGYVSALKKKAQFNLDYLEYKSAVKTTDSEFIWKCWNLFVKKLEMPLFLDVELEFVLNFLHPEDIKHFMYWYYSFGEFIRSSLTYYIYKEDKIKEEITEYLYNATEQELAWFKQNYLNAVPLVQIVYIRLITEVARRKGVGLNGSNKAIDGLRTAVEKLAEKVNMPPEQFFANRIYPIISTIRNTRMKQFYRFYTGKNLKK
ncbi:MAG: hypothetical protein IJQ07_04200 [Clostridia bacterium]|nr:hypothetical protein [Clostridia bacterium]